MEAKDLMIGDFVECVDSTHQNKVYAQVGAIEEGQTCILVEKDCCNWFLDITFLDPIPLNPNILESNSFVKEYGGAWNIYRHAVKKWFVLFKKEFGFTLHIGETEMRLDYVHELQHILRVCGIEKEIVL